MVSRLDPYTAEILRSAFNSTAREQQITCTKCSFSYVFALGEEIRNGIQWQNAFELASPFYHQYHERYYN